MIVYGNYILQKRRPRVSTGTVEQPGNDFGFGENSQKNELSISSKAGEQVEVKSEASYAPRHYS